MEVLYLCDKGACKDCRPECKHTRNVEHAENFKQGFDGTYIEQEKDKGFFTKLAASAMSLTLTVGILALGFKFVMWLLF